MVSAASGRPSGVLSGAAMLPPAEPTRAPACTPPVRRRSRGRFEEINGFIDLSMAKLTPAARSVWLIWWRDTKPDGLARTGQADIARRAGVSDRAVRDALAELIREGLVKVVRKGRLGVGPSTYRVRGVD